MPGARVEAANRAAAERAAEEAATSATRAGGIAADDLAVDGAAVFATNYRGDRAFFATDDDRRVYVDGEPAAPEGAGAFAAWFATYAARVASSVNSSLRYR